MIKKIEKTVKSYYKEKKIEDNIKKEKMNLAVKS